MDPALVHEHRVLAVFISGNDPRDQCVLGGKARWDGSALWLNARDLPEPLLILKPGAHALLVKVTPDLLAAFTEGTEHGAELGPIVNEAEFVSFSEVTHMPVGALSIPGAFAQALVPHWRAQ